MSRYVVGIDLGTTNCTLAYAEASAAGSDQPGPIASLPIPQVVAVNDVAERPLLPSFLYLPSAKEFPSGGAGPALEVAAGAGRGCLRPRSRAKVPGRLVSSAKSWLSHAGVDRRSAILPWTAAEDVATDLAGRGVVGLPRTSPRCLEPPDRRQVRGRPAGESGRLPDCPRLVRRRGARADVEAAAKAGLKQVTLLEEPQAAFYAWLALRATSGGRR